MNYKIILNHAIFNLGYIQQNLSNMYVLYDQLGSLLKCTLLISVTGDSNLVGLESTLGRYIFNKLPRRFCCTKMEKCLFMDCWR